MPTYFDSAALKANTENGRDWLQKYLHPPSTKGPSYAGFPDKSVLSSVHSEYRLNYEGLPLATNQGSNTGAMLFLCAPGLLNPVFSARNLNGDNPDWTTLLVNTEITQADVILNIGKQRMVYRSETFQYDSTDFNNNGMLYSAQFSPTVYTAEVGNIIFRLMQQKSPHLKGIIEHLSKTHGPKVAAALKQLISEDDFDIVSPRSVNLTMITFRWSNLTNLLFHQAMSTCSPPRSIRPGRAKVRS
jgi:hypothetical protein